MNSYWVVHVSAQKITETTKSLKICCFVFSSVFSVFSVFYCVLLPFGVINDDLKIVSRQTEMIHQQRVGRLSHEVTECAAGK